MSVFRVFLVRILPHPDWIQRDSSYLSVFSPNAGKYGSEKLPIRALFTQCLIFFVHFIIDFRSAAGREKVSEHFYRVQEVFKNLIYVRIYDSCRGTLREKCPNTELFLVRIFLYSDWIRDLLCKSPYSIRIQENMDQE